LKTSYIYADGQILSQRIHTDPNNSDLLTPYYYVHDRLGSVRLMIDDTGTAVNSYTYKPYGSFYEGEAVETIANPWKFTGQYYDAEIEQYYLRARQYDPAMMRFTSRDPFAGTINESLTLHKYLYCVNNPANRVDPSGRMSYGDTSMTTFIISALDNMVLGAVGGLLEGVFKEIIDWGNGEEFSWKDIGVSSAAGAVSGLLTGGFSGRGGVVKTVGRAFWKIGIGFIGAVGSEFVKNLSGPVTKMQGSNAMHVMGTNAIIESVDIGWS
jgi:RHS repeat-associated protein